MAFFHGKRTAIGKQPRGSLAGALAAAALRSISSSPPQVGICTYAIERDPRWFANTERFDPDRWEGELAKRIPRFAYFPFGGGQRFCIGQQFALMEAQLVLTVMAQRFDLQLVPGHPVVPQPSVTMRPKFRLKMVLRRR